MSAEGRGLALEDFRPASMLRVARTLISTPRFPVIDFHTHLTWSPGLEPGDAIKVIAGPSELLPTMDAKHVRIMVNLTGGYGDGLGEALRVHPDAHPGRFLTFTEPWWSRVAEPGYARFQADEVERAHRAGARGLKVLKILGLFAREHGTTGSLIAVDDPRFDPTWEVAGALGMPVVIHVPDPTASPEHARTQIALRGRTLVGGGDGDDFRRLPTCYEIYVAPIKGRNGDDSFKTLRALMRALPNLSRNQPVQVSSAP